MDNRTPSPCATTLVIGFGNTLRSDDGVGPRVASVVAGWGLPGVVAIAVHQLGPELAEPLAEAGRAFFVDARLAGESESYQTDRRTNRRELRSSGRTDFSLSRVLPVWILDRLKSVLPSPVPRARPCRDPYQVRPVEAADVAPTFGHTGDPRALLALTQAAFGRHPAAWSITVPATVLDFGEGLSPTAGRAMAAALRYLSSVCSGAGHPELAQVSSSGLPEKKRRLSPNRPCRGIELQAGPI
jgi:hydrogenase maturation protease